MHKRTIAAVLTGLLLVACWRGTFNDADVTFAAEAVRHDMQALVSTALAASKSQAEEVREAVARKETRAYPEIDMTTGWLKSWNETAPMTESAMRHADSTRIARESSDVLNTLASNRIALGLMGTPANPVQFILGSADAHGVSPVA